MIAWLMLFAGLAGRTEAGPAAQGPPMIIFVCVAVLAVLVFLSLTGSAGKSGSQ